MMRKIFFLMALSAVVVTGAYGQAVTVSAPNGGESWQQGSVQNISWKVTNYTGKVHIVLYKDKVKVGNIARNVSATAGSFRWEVGKLVSGKAPAGSGYRVWIWAADWSFKDTSDRDFSISPTAQGNRILDTGNVTLQQNRIQPQVVDTRVTLTPLIRIFASRRGSIAVGESLEFQIDFSNGDQAHIREQVSGKEHPVTGIKNGSFTGNFSIVPTSRQDTKMILVVKNRLAESKKECIVKIMLIPEIVRFEPVKRITEKGYPAKLKVSFKNAVTARIIDLETNQEIWKSPSYPDYDGVIQTPVLSTPKEYSFKLELTIGGWKIWSAVASVEALYGDPRYKPIISDFHADPLRVANPGDSARFYYRYSRSSSAWIVNLENNQRTVLPASFTEVNGSINLAVPYTSNYKLLVENEYGASEKYGKVEVSSHPGPVIKVFKAEKEWFGDKVNIEFEVWGAISLELFRARDTQGGNRVSILKSSGKEPLKGKFTDDPLWFPAVYELRVVFPGGQTTTEFRTVKK